MVPDPIPIKAVRTIIGTTTGIIPTGDAKMPGSLLLDEISFAAKLCARTDPADQFRDPRPGSANSRPSGYYADYGIAVNYRCLAWVYRAVERHRMLRSRSWPDAARAELCSSLSIFTQAKAGLLAFALYVTSRHFLDRPRPARRCVCERGAIGHIPIGNLPLLKNNLFHN